LRHSQIITIITIKPRTDVDPVIVKTNPDSLLGTEIGRHFVFNPTFKEDEPAVFRIQLNIP